MGLFLFIFGVCGLSLGYSEKKELKLEEIIAGVCEKLITRHPHIYGNVKVENEEDVKRNWEKIKLKEGKFYLI